MARCDAGAEGFVAGRVEIVEIAARNASVVPWHANATRYPFAVDVIRRTRHDRRALVRLAAVDTSTLLMPGRHHDERDKLASVAIIPKRLLGDG